MLTVGEWFEILRYTKNMVFGLQMKYGLPCNRYLIAQEFEKHYKREKALIEWIQANQIKILNSGIKTA